MKTKVARPQEFTVAGANRTLPLVKAIVTDIVALYRDVSERKERLESLRKRRPKQSKRDDDPYREEVDQIRHGLEKDVERLQAYVDELSDLGIALKDPSDGLVDFPTLMDGSPAFLCWKLGEPEVAFWHRADVAVTNRQPLPPTSTRPADHAV